MDKFDNIEELIDEFIESLPCQSSMKYPEGCVSGENLKYAEMIYDAYASSADSELQAIVQYLYHAHTIENKTITNALLCISMIEMEHFDKLSDLIKEFGGKPAYYNSNKYYWITANIPYGDKDMLETKLDEKALSDRKTIHEKLMLDIKSEINAINGYKFLRNSINDKYFRGVIDKIISDEEVHIDIFQELIKKCL